MHIFVLEESESLWESPHCCIFAFALAFPNHILKYLGDDAHGTGLTLSWPRWWLTIIYGKIESVSLCNEEELSSKSSHIPGMWMRKPHRSHWKERYWWCFKQMSIFYVPWQMIRTENCAEDKHRLSDNMYRFKLGDKYLNPFQVAHPYHHVAHT